VASCDVFCFLGEIRGLSVVVVYHQTRVLFVNQRRTGSAALVDYEDVVGLVFKHLRSLGWAVDGVAFGEKVDFDEIFG